MDNARNQMTREMQVIVGYISFLFFWGCHREDVSDDQISQKISWSSARYSGSKEAWVFKNFYTRIDEDLAAVEYYTEDKPNVERRTDLELLLESCSLARKKFGDAYQLGNIDSSYENSYTPTFIIVSLRRNEEPLKCAVILKFANLFDPNLKLSDGQIIYDLPGRTNKEIVEKWKAAGEWQNRIADVK